MSLKERIVRVALELFGNKGYTKTTIADICKLADTSKGGFYHHFDSKEQVLETITEMVFREVKDRYATMLNDSESDVFTLLSEVFVTINAYEKDQYARLYNLVKLFGHSESHYIITKLAFSFEALTASIYEKFLRRGISEGLFKLENPQALSQLWSHEMVVLYGLIRHIVAQPAVADLRTQYLERARFLEGIINNALRQATGHVTIVQQAEEYLTLIMHQTTEDQAF